MDEKDDPVPGRASLADNWRSGGDEQAGGWQQVTRRRGARDSQKSPAQPNGGRGKAKGKGKGATKADHSGGAGKDGKGWGWTGRGR